MPRISRLPPDLANQIAAGEVVERPASVVKELIENALDASATRIAVATEFGGKRLIRVDDNGGMDPDDARLALERHATSKIARADDLAAIVTFGFRGEALPAIASVSRLVLRTRPRGATTGTEVRVQSGTVSAVTEIGAPEGTSVEVADLFYNLPARRKFLKADAAESAQVTRVVTQLALANPMAGFTLTSAGRPVLDCPPVRGLAERFYQLYGERPDLVEVRKEASGIRVRGYIAVGAVKVALYDTRKDSPTHGELMELFMGEQYGAQVLKVPPGVAHGYRVLEGPAHLFYITSSTYDAQDEGRIPHDDPTIGYDWTREPEIK